MAFIETSKFCKNCNKQVLARRKGVNHILHLILSICTIGWWIIMWVLVFIYNMMVPGEWRCSVCGQTCWGLLDSDIEGVSDILKPKSVDGGSWFGNHMSDFKKGFKEAMEESPKETNLESAETDESSINGVAESNQDSTPDQTKVFCTQCGEPNTKDNSFCSKCGKALT